MGILHRHRIPPSPPPPTFTFPGDKYVSKQSQFSLSLSLQVNATPDERAQDRNIAEHTFHGVKGHLRPENNNKPETKNKKMLHAAKMVQQMTNVTTFLSSLKKEPDYVFVDIPKHPDGKLLLDDSLYLKMVLDYILTA